MRASHLLVDDANGVRTITFDRPEVKNALTLAMRQLFCALVDAADRDLNAALALETAHIANGPAWDADAFAAAGTAAAARQRD